MTIKIDSYLKSLQADPSTGKLTDPTNAFKADNIPTPEATYYNIIYQFLIIAGVVAVLSLIYGGILYVTSAGEAEKAERAKKTITGAIIGIIIITVSYSAYHYILGALG